MKRFGNSRFNRIIKTTIALTMCAVAFQNCGGGEEGDANVECDPVEAGEPRLVIHQLDDPDRLNPITNSGASSTALMFDTHQRLISVDFTNPDGPYLPVLAESVPTPVEVDSNTLEITYTIREEATWDDGSPVTGHDVAFTIKAIKNPKMDTQHKRPYVEFIRDVKIDPNNPKVVTFVCDRYIRAIYGTGAEVYIVPEYVYDANQVMRNFSVPDLTENAAALSEDPQIIAFAQDLNGEKWQREKGYIAGSGAYSFESWETGKRITLVKKENWWGDQLAGTNHYFDAKVPTIVHQIVTDAATAQTSLQNGLLDVYTYSKQRDFVEAEKDNDFTCQFNLEETNSLIYTYLGLNTANEKLSDKRARQALCMLTDYQRILERLYYNKGTRTIGPVMPFRDYYNNEITPYEYDPKKALELFKAAGIEDTDGDGNLDYFSEETLQQEQYTLKFSINQGNEARKQLAQVLKEECGKIGLEINIVQKEWSVYLDELKAHNFEIYYGAWVGEFAPQDPTQLWHTSSINGGSNYPSWGDFQSDQLIERIRVEIDDAKRKELWFQFQEMLHEDAPYIFLAGRPRLLAISKRFNNGAGSAMDPGYWGSGFEGNY